jgi:hypothetical protein
MTAEDRMERAIRWIMIGAVLFVSAMFIVVALVGSALAQHAGHPPEHQGIHDRFYKAWKMPKNRSVSCCHDEDCKPAEAYMKNGQWYARQEGDTGEFTPIPKDAVDMGLLDSPDPPDTRAHLCGRRYGFNEGGFTVFCFISGSGT